MTLEKLREMTKKFPRDASAHWKCILCNWEIRLAEPLVIGMVCCGQCGMSTLRPFHDFKKIFARRRYYRRMERMKK